MEFVSRKEAIDTTTPTGKFMLTVFAAVAELEREYILQRQREGIDAAKKRGAKFGRPTKDFPPCWQEDKLKWEAGEVTAVSLMKKYGMASSTFYSKVNTDKIKEKN